MIVAISIDIFHEWWWLDRAPYLGAPIDCH